MNRSWNTSRATLPLLIRPPKSYIKEPCHRIVLPMFHGRCPELGKMSARLFFQKPRKKEKSLDGAVGLAEELVQEGGMKNETRRLRQESHDEKGYRRFIKDRQRSCSEWDSTEGRRRHPPEKSVRCTGITSGPGIALVPRAEPGKPNTPICFFGNRTCTGFGETNEKRCLFDPGETSPPPSGKVPQGEGGTREVPEEEIRVQRTERPHEGDLIGAVCLG